MSQSETQIKIISDHDDFRELTELPDFYYLEYNSSMMFQAECGSLSLIHEGHRVECFSSLGAPLNHFIFGEPEFCILSRKNIIVYYSNPNNPGEKHMWKAQHNVIELSNNNLVKMLNDKI